MQTIKEKSAHHVNSYLPKITAAQYDAVAFEKMKTLQMEIGISFVDIKKISMRGAIEEFSQKKLSEFPNIVYFDYTASAGGNSMYSNYPLNDLDRYLKIARKKGLKKTIFGITLSSRNQDLPLIQEQPDYIFRALGFQIYRILARNGFQARNRFDSRSLSCKKYSRIQTPDGRRSSLMYFCLGYGKQIESKSEIIADSHLFKSSEILFDLKNNRILLRKWGFDGSNQENWEVFSSRSRPYGMSDNYSNFLKSLLNKWIEKSSNNQVVENFSSDADFLKYVLIEHLFRNGSCNIRDYRIMKQLDKMKVLETVEPLAITQNQLNIFYDALKNDPRSPSNNAENHPHLLQYFTSNNSLQMNTDVESSINSIADSNKSEWNIVTEEPREKYFREIKQRNKEIIEKYMGLKKKRKFSKEMPRIKMQKLKTGPGNLRDSQRSARPADKIQNKYRTMNQHVDDDAFEETSQNSTDSHDAPIFDDGCNKEDNLIPSTFFYTVIEGDNLSKISSKVFGPDGALQWPTIIEANPQHDSLNNITIGERLVIPVINDQAISFYKSYCSASKL